MHIKNLPKQVIPTDRKLIILTTLCHSHHTMAPQMQNSLSREVGNDWSRVVAKLASPMSMRMTRSTFPVPTKWMTGCQANLTMWGIMCWSL